MPKGIKNIFYRRTTFFHLIIFFFKGNYAPMLTLSSKDVIFDYNTVGVILIVFVFPSHDNNKMRMMMMIMTIERNLNVTGPIVIRTEEAFIVICVMILWVAAIALFFNRWGKIRMLEPYQPKFHEEEHRPSCPMVELASASGIGHSITGGVSTPKLQV